MAITPPCIDELLLFSPPDHPTGGGSVGGKARGLAFFNALLSAYRKPFEGLEIEVPPGIVIGTDVYDRFMSENGLQSIELAGISDDEILRRFLGAQRFPASTKSGPPPAHSSTASASACECPKLSAPCGPPSITA